MTQGDPSDPKVPQGLGSPGPNWLFFGVLAGVFLGAAAGIFVSPREPAAALRSSFVFRIEVGLIVAVVAYWTASALWLAWHRTLFQRLGLGSAGAETPEQKEALEQRDKRIGDFITETRETLENLTGRIEALEDQLGSRP